MPNGRDRTGTRNRVSPDLQRRIIDLSVSRNYQEKLRIATGNETIARQPTEFDLDRVLGVYDYAVGEVQYWHWHLVDTISVPQDGVVTTTFFPQDNRDILEAFKTAKIVKFKGCSFDGDSLMATLSIDLIWTTSINGLAHVTVLLGQQVPLNAIFPDAVGGEIAFHIVADLPLPSGRSRYVDFETTPTIVPEIQTGAEPLSSVLRFRRDAEINGAQLIRDFTLFFELTF